MTQIIVPGRTSPEYRYGGKELKRGGTPRRVRRVWCLTCRQQYGTRTELAKEAGDVGERADEWWSVKPDGTWVNGKWWGNQFKCPTCGQEGRLPMDKPKMEKVNA